MEETLATVALSQCLVVWLGQRYRFGLDTPEHQQWGIRETKWRDARYGLEAEIILDAAGRERLVTDDLEDLLERLTPLARELRCEEELRQVAQIPRTGAAYQRQRKVLADTGGDLVAVVEAVVRELEP